MARVKAEVRGRGRGRVDPRVRVDPTLALEPLARETASMKQLLTKPIPSRPYERRLVQLLGLRHRRSQRSYRDGIRHQRIGEGGWGDWE